MTRTTDLGGGWAEAETFRPDTTSQLAQRLHDLGLIYAANRLVFHRVGFALGVAGKGTADNFKVNGIALYRSDDPEGVVYAKDGQHERGMRKLRTAQDLAGGPGAWSGWGDLVVRVEDMNLHGSDDSAGAECSRLEADLAELDHVLVTEANMTGSINAESIEERLRLLIRLADRTSKLASKLDEMALHDDTGDPRDEGYMAAIRELREFVE